MTPQDIFFFFSKQTPLLVIHAFSIISAFFVRFQMDHAPTSFFFPLAICR